MDPRTHARTRTHTHTHIHTHTHAHITHAGDFHEALNSRIHIHIWANLQLGGCCCIRFTRSTWICLPCRTGGCGGCQPCSTEGCGGCQPCSTEGCGGCHLCLPCSTEGCGGCHLCANLCGKEFEPVSKVVPYVLVDGPVLVRGCRTSHQRAWHGNEAANDLGSIVMNQLATHSMFAGI